MFAGDIAIGVAAAGSVFPWAAMGRGPWGEQALWASMSFVANALFQGDAVRSMLSCEIKVLDSLPAEYKPYQGQYLLVKSGVEVAEWCIYYVASDEKAQKIAIDNMDKFKAAFAIIEAAYPTAEGSYKLKAKEIKDLITVNSNPGHSPPIVSRNPWQYAAFILSVLGNSSLAAAALDRMQRMNAHWAFVGTFGLFSVLGVGLESVISVRGLEAIKDESLRWGYTLGAIFSDACASEMYAKWYPLLREDFERVASLHLSPQAAKYFLQTAHKYYEEKDYAAAYLLLEGNLPYPAWYYRLSLAVSPVIGGVTAVGYSANGVALIKKALGEWISKSIPSALEAAVWLAIPWGEVLLWACNAFPLGFGVTYGIDGTRRFLTQVLPLLIHPNATAEQRTSALLTLGITVLSAGPGMAIKGAAGSDTRLAQIGQLSSFFTNNAPLTGKFADSCSEKIVAGAHCVADVFRAVFCEGASAPRHEHTETTRLLNAVL